MNSTKRNPKRRTKYRWISIEKPITTVKKTCKADYTDLTSLSQDFDMPPLEEPLCAMPVEVPKASFNMSPKYLNPFSPRKRSKYCCPYYLKPKDWNLHSSQAEVSLKDEVERIKNFYYHMHDNQSLNPLEKSAHTQTLASLSSDLASLPPIQKYKQYLISKSLRLPSFLSNPKLN
jgi:hypothetical protein